MGKKRLRVVHKPAGYVAYKDEVPIRRMNLRAVLMIFGAVFALGSVATLTVSALVSSQQPEQLPTLAPEITQEVTLAVASPTNAPTMTASVIPSSTPTITPTPIASLKMTVDALSLRLESMREATPQVITATPAPAIAQPTIAASVTPAYIGYAVVLVDCAVIRAGAGRHTRAIGSACRGARYPVLDIYNSWVQIVYEGFDSAWIANHLVRIEP